MTMSMKLKSNSVLFDLCFYSELLNYYVPNVMIKTLTKDTLT